MDAHQMEALLRSWGRISTHRARACLPSKGMRLMDATEAGEAVCRLYGEALGMGKSAAHALGDMSLEVRELGEDPLTPSQAVAFAGLMGSTMGWHTVDGYLNFREAVGRAMVRARERAEGGQPRLDSCRLELHGENPVGVLEVTDAADRQHVFCFTQGSVAVRRGGMTRSCALPAPSLFGMGCVLEGSWSRAGGTSASPARKPRVRLAPPEPG